MIWEAFHVVSYRMIFNNHYAVSTYYESDVL